MPLLMSSLQHSQPPLLPQPLSASRSGEPPCARLSLRQPHTQPRSQLISLSLKGTLLAARTQGPLRRNPRVPQGPSTINPQGAQGPLKNRRAFKQWGRLSDVLVRASATPVSEQEPSAGPQPASGTPPAELSTLSDLVSQLSGRSKEGDSVEVKELQKAFERIAEDLKKQISAVKGPAAVSAATGTGSASSNVPSRRRLVPPSDAESYRLSTGYSDLDGLFPRSGDADSQAVRTDGDEPMVPRSEVISMRSRLNKKLSESNTYNRFLMREIQYREDAMKDAKAMLVALVSDLKEVAAGVVELAAVESFLPSSMVSSTCMPSVLKTKLEALVEEVEQQVQGVERMKLREVPLTWFGMAEDVKVMGSFDGWTYGEQLSPEFTGTMTRFTTVLKVRPGRYEIKFVVDGEWRVAPQWPTVGHGMLENNVLVVD